MAGGMTLCAIFTGLLYLCQPRYVAKCVFSMLQFCALLVSFKWLPVQKDFLWSIAWHYCGRTLHIVTICTYVCTFYFLYREVTVAFLFCARACISGASQILYVYTAEVYPTEVRGLGLGIASAVGSGGSIIMPYIAQVRMHVAITQQLIRVFLYNYRSGSAKRDCQLSLFVQEFDLICNYCNLYIDCRQIGIY